MIVRRAAAGLALALGFGAIALAAPSPAHAAVTSAGDWATLQALVTGAADGDVIVLVGGTIANPPGSNLEVPPGVTLTIDLHGTHLVVDASASPGAAVDVSDATSGIVIRDVDGGGAGRLTAIGSPGAAGIGGSAMSFAGTIVILGGTIEATGGDGGAGIGGGQGDASAPFGGVREVRIEGGTVTARGGAGAAGIGGGSASIGTVSLPVTISGGSVTAFGGAGAGGVWSNAAGIGGGGSEFVTGDGGSGFAVTISGGSVMAVGGDASYGGWLGAGIGAGDGNPVTATPGTLTLCGNAEPASTATDGGAEAGSNLAAPIVACPSYHWYTAVSSPGRLSVVFGDPTAAAPALPATGSEPAAALAFAGVILLAGAAALRLGARRRRD
ncbi:MAG: hypothetical protein BGO95_09510 [Micrococcales bacterium 73-13]|nr:MAG: hypothetical protein BGO95_09510 [Micrococcales bacterium 73-13]